MNFSEYMTHKCLTISSRVIYILLEKPLLSTILSSLFIIIFFITLFVSFVIITITLCCILVIIIGEGILKYIENIKHVVKVKKGYSFFGLFWLYNERVFKAKISIQKYWRAININLFFIVLGAIIIVSTLLIIIIIAIFILIYVMLTGMKIEIEHIKRNIRE